MPRPCHLAHPLTPLSCRVCHWCADLSEMGAFHRGLWGERQPGAGLDAASVPPPTVQPGPCREIVPGLPDPIPDDEAWPARPGWAHAPQVIGRHRAALFGLLRSDLPRPNARAGAGVLLVGGGKYWPGIVVAVKMLRQAGSRLPVQLWHRGAEEPVGPGDLAGVPGVEIRDLTRLPTAPRILRAWEAKTVALLECGWERVFYLDADAYVVRDPAPLMDCLCAAEPFLFWRDLPGPHGAVRWPTWGLADSPVPAIQGGQFAIHFSHFWREFVLAHWLNQHSDFSYSHQYGDQDSWRVALTLTGGPFACLGEARWDDIAFVCDAGDNPYVVHRCRSKMLYSEDVMPGDGESNRQLARLPGETKAWAFFNQLRSNRTASDVFGRVYSSGLWGPDDISGSGSTPEAGGVYLAIVNALVKLAGWRRVIDLGSGDGWIASRLEAPEVVAVDCYSPHIARLRREAPGREWLNLDLDRDREKLPPGDVAFVKDVLQHWPNGLVRDWLTWARQCGKWKWVVFTQDHHQEADWEDCHLGGFRGLDPAMEPLRSLGLLPFCTCLYKSVLLQPVRGQAGGGGDD